MLTAVEFDDQLRRPTGEVRNFAPDRELVGELVTAKLLSAQPRPNELFGIGPFAPEPLRRSSQAFPRHLIWRLLVHEIELRRLAANRRQPEREHARRTESRHQPIAVSGIPVGLNAAIN